MDNWICIAISDIGFIYLFMISVIGGFLLIFFAEFLFLFR